MQKHNNNFRNLCESLKEMGVPMNRDIMDGVSDYVLNQKEKGFSIEDIKPSIVAQYLDQNTEYDIRIRRSTNKSEIYWERVY